MAEILRLSIAIVFVSLLAVSAFAVTTSPYDAHTRTALDDGAGNIALGARATYHYSPARLSRPAA